MPDARNHSGPDGVRLRFRHWNRLAAIATVVLGVLAGLAYWRNAAPPNPADSTAQLEPPETTSGTLPASLGESWQTMDDPLKDGWDIEAFTQQATDALKQLGKVLAHPEHNDQQHLASLITDTFSCTPLLPQSRSVVLDDALFSIERAGPVVAQADARPRTSDVHTGVMGFSAAIATLIKPLMPAQDIRCRFKLFRATRRGEAVVTEQYIALSGRVSGGVVEQNATWMIDWAHTPGQAPQIERIRVLNFEQVRGNTGRGTMFADCTQSVLESNSSYREQFLRGRNHWLNQSQDTRYTYLLGNPGLAIGDVNGDGLDDVYACQEEGLPNRLFIQNADGTAVDVSKTWGVDWLHNSRSALLIDLDNDADQDLVVAVVGGLIVASNEGDTFRVRTVLPTDEDLMSLCAADYDGDADLDVYVCAYNGNEELSATTRGGLIGGAIASNSFTDPQGGRNTLFRNDIVSATEWVFTDVTQAAQFDPQFRPLSLAAAWEDYDNDGDPDLYVANDYGNNQFFRNDSGKFVETTSVTGSEDRGFGMSVTWGDFDRNGWMDVYVSNMFSAAGNRVTFQPQFLKDSPVMKRQLQRFARGNTLLRNNGPQPNFTDVSQASAVTIGRWAWSSNFVDINNDGWEDLVVANGYVTTDDTSDL